MGIVTREESEDILLDDVIGLSIDRDDHDMFEVSCSLVYERMIRIVSLLDGEELQIGPQDIVVRLEYLHRPV